MTCRVQNVLEFKTAILKNLVDKSVELLSMQLSSASGADDWRAGCCTRKRAYRVLEAVFERARSAAALLTPAVLASLLSGGVPAPETNSEFVPECSSPSAERVRLAYAAHFTLLLRHGPPVLTILASASR